MRATAACDDAHILTLEELCVAWSTSQVDIQYSFCALFLDSSLAVSHALGLTSVFWLGQARLIAIVGNLHHALPGRS